MTEDDNNKVYTSEDKEKAETLDKFFSSVFTVEDMNNIPKLEPGEKSEGKFLLDIIITVDTVRAKLKALNPNKSPGPDKIYPRILKELSNELAEPLTYLFKKSPEEGKLPDDWKHAEVTAIFKKGEKSNPSNYRPVSLTSVVCKIMESFVRDAIQEHMESNKLYTSCQHGFRRGRSCISQLLEVMEDFTNYIDNGQTFDTIYLDFRKAFDTVPHARLLCKLKAYGIDGKVVDWIQMFLSNRTQQVRVGKEYSSRSQVSSGIPQGSVLGPVLFTIFINDLPEGLESLCKIFADDTKIYNVSNQKVTIQNDLSKIQEWSLKWQLFFNGDKCICLHYGYNNPKYDYYFYNNSNTKKLSEGEQEKDLGVIFDITLKFDIHINSQVEKANKVTGMIKGILISWINLPLIIYTKL